MLNAPNEYITFNYQKIVEGVNLKILNEKASYINGQNFNNCDCTAL